MKYRFTAEDFHPTITGQDWGAGWDRHAVADRANSLLEQWEKESEAVYGLQVHSQFGALPWIYTCEKSHVHTHKAILWRPEPIPKP